MNIGYKRLMQPLLAAQSRAKDSADEYGQAVNTVRALWGPQRLRVLETVSVRPTLSFLWDSVMFKTVLNRHETTTMT
jgi:hypothetical protein